MSLLANSNAIETGGYQISRSVRLRSSASAYLNRTLTTPTNNKIFTYSLWAKRGTLGSAQMLLSGGDGSSNNDAWFGFNSSDQLVFASLTGGAYKIQVNTSAVFRDPSAFYSIVLFVDNTQATNSNGIKIYVNGVNQTLTYTTWVQNGGSSINTANPHYIGRLNYSAVQYFDGYLTEVNFIDGQALTPSSFGETDTITGSWVAKKYTGTYGTNGFYLNFSDNSAATSTTIGKDYSGNGNNWTPNNISVTAGTTYDSMLDVPSGNGYADGGNGRGNYAVLNPLDKNASITLSNGNLNASFTNFDQAVKGTIVIPSTGKWYWECIMPSSGTATHGEFGICRPNAPTNVDEQGNANFWFWYSNGSSALKYTAGSSASYGTATRNNNDVVAIAFDRDAGSVEFYYNNIAQGTCFSSLSGEFVPFMSLGTTATRAFDINFGQRPFSYTPPTGFKALNTTNLSDPTIKNGAGYMAAYLYTADNTSPKSRTGIGFAPDFLWFKDRTSAFSHALYDTVRGTNKGLQTNSTAAENSYTLLSAFGSDGFTTTNDGGVGNLLNYNTDNYVTWAWKANGAGVSNTAGTITSTVSANTTSGFSIVTYTGTGANATVGHGLGVAPSMVIVKSRSVAGRGWIVWHSSLAATEALELSVTDAKITSTTSWNSTAPSSTVISLGTRLGTNESGTTFVCYAFATVPGYSAFGSYTGNGSSDGPFVYCGFRPRWVMIKSASNVGGVTNWTLIDTARSTYNVTAANVYANASSAEDASTYLDVTANGFKVRNTFRDVNDSTGTMIYAAFAEVPFKFSNAR